MLQSSTRIWATLLGVAVWASASTVVSTAAAYCRTTTCNAAEDGPCGPRGGCMDKGEPLFWPDLCVTFGVHADGSTKRAIPYPRAEEVARAAFQEWISADCGDGLTPSIGVVPRGQVYCDLLEFNHSGSESENAPGPNANLIVFRDDSWPYNDTATTIALTTITFATKTGEILDADIEVNSADIEISTSDDVVTSDLQSILTHEVGHFFGLAHSSESRASMFANYDKGDKSFRSLSQDDTNGICSIYPGISEPITDCTGEEPRNGFSRYCGTPDEADAGVLCATDSRAVGRDGAGSGAFALIGVGLIGIGAYRRRQR